jgi:hypothetical protein
MESNPFCNVLLNLATQTVIAQAILAATSAILDKIPGWLALHANLKRTVWGLLAVGFPIGAYYLGTALGCVQVPALSVYLYAGANVALGILLNGGLSSKRTAVKKQNDACTCAK